MAPFAEHLVKLIAEIQFGLSGETDPAKYDFMSIAKFAFNLIL